MSALTLECEVVSMSRAVLLARAGENRFECGDYGSVKLALNSLREPQPCDSTRHSVAIWSIRGHGIVRIRDRDDFGKQWNLFPAQPIGIAKPVDSLMVMANNLCDLGVVLNLGKNPLADETYAELLQKLEDRKFAGVPVELARDINGHFAGAAVPSSGSDRATTKEEKRLRRLLAALNAAASGEPSNAARELR